MRLHQTRNARRIKAAIHVRTIYGRRDVKARADLALRRAMRELRERVYRVGAFTLITFFCACC